MDFTALLDRFTAAVTGGDGAALAALFAEDGVYHDGFYGAFEGRDAIRAMIEEHFHRDAEDFKWEMVDATHAGGIGYARYRFSFTSKLEGCEGRRVVFEGIGCFHMVGEHIRRYEEVFDAGLAMAQLGFPPERLAKSLARRAERLRADPAMAHHLAGDA